MAQGQTLKAPDQVFLSTVPPIAQRPCRWIGGARRRFEDGEGDPKAQKMFATGVATSEQGQKAQDS